MSFQSSSLCFSAKTTDNVRPITISQCYCKPILFLQAHHKYSVFVLPFRFPSEDDATRLQDMPQQREILWHRRRKCREEAMNRAESILSIRRLNGGRSCSPDDGDVMGVEEERTHCCCCGYLAHRINFNHSLIPWVRVVQQFVIMCQIADYYRQWNVH